MAKALSGRSGRTNLPREVARELQSYVYVLLDPTDGQPGVPFYVGKGRGGRAVSHLNVGDLRAAVELGDDDTRTRSATQRRIAQIRRSGREPGIDIVRHRLTEEEAFKVEAALIATLPGLTNAVGGHDRGEGRAPLAEVIARYGAPLLDGSEPPSVLIRLGDWRAEKDRLEGSSRRVGKGWYHGITDVELYDSMRAWWRVSPANVERLGVRYAVAVHAQVTRGVVEIDRGSWRRRSDGRYLFAGRLLRSGRAFDAYVGRLGKRVPFTQSAQNPIGYWPREA